MTQQLLEELEALREAHRTARTQQEFEALWSRLQTIEALSAGAARRSKAEKDALDQVKKVVLGAIRANREGLDQPTNLSATVFAMMQAVRRGTTGYTGEPEA